MNILNNSKIKTYLGFAIKSGNLYSGYDTCANLIKRNKLKLLILTEDASDKTKDKFTKLAEKYEVPLSFVDSSALMEELTGISDRNIYGISDNNLANAISKEINNMIK